MSYILEALKKSEQERGHGGSPGIQTIHSSSLSYREHRKPLWPWLLFAILCVNLAMLVYFVLSRSDGDAGMQPLVASAPTPTQVIPEVPRQQPALAPKPEPKRRPSQCRHLLSQSSQHRHTKLQFRPGQSYRLLPRSR